MLGEPGRIQHCRLGESAPGVTVVQPMFHGSLRGDRPSADGRCSPRISSCGTAEHCRWRSCDAQSDAPGISGGRGELSHAVWRTQESMLNPSTGSSKASEGHATKSPVDKRRRPSQQCRSEQARWCMSARPVRNADRCRSRGRVDGDRIQRSVGEGKEDASGRDKTLCTGAHGPRGLHPISRRRSAGFLMPGRQRRCVQSQVEASRTTWNAD